MSIRISCAIMLMLLFSGCSLWGSPSSYKVATAAGAAGLARWEGVLGGQTKGDGTACFWIGDGENRTFLVWPQGYSAKGNPLTIVDQNGQGLATVGQRVALGGRRDARATSVQGCSGAAQVWVVGEVMPLEN
jgi:hypothetical protein